MFLSHREKTNCCYSDIVFNVYFVVGVLSGAAIRGMKANWQCLHMVGTSFICDDVT